MTTSDAPIGVIGLGEMGSAIAGRLLSQGAKLVAYDSNDALRPVWPQIDWAPSATAVATLSSRIIVVVATDEQVNEVVNAVADAATSSTVVILHSTVDPLTVIAAQEQLAPAGAQLVDVGMSRGPGRMADGYLTLFAGGTAEVVEAVRPLLALYSNNIVHAGPVGSGMVLKLCNNLALHGNRLVLLEAVRLAEAFGVDRHRLLAGVTTSTGASWVASHWGRTDDSALGQGLGETSMVRRTCRELDLAVRLAEREAVQIPAAQLVARRLPTVLEHGLDATDAAAQLDHQQLAVNEWRAERDRLGSRFRSPLLLLTTTGARTGKTRTWPLRYTVDNDRLIVFASNGGASQHPGWYLNLRANPRAAVEIGTATTTVDAVDLVGSDRDDVYRRQAAGRPEFAEYQAATSRRIPVVWFRLPADQPLSSIVELDAL
jgi:deazaflavin-dependent oxidoreductase (nitroreductase family)